MNIKDPTDHYLVADLKWKTLALVDLLELPAWTEEDYLQACHCLTRYSHQKKDWIIEAESVRFLIEYPLTPPNRVDELKRLVVGAHLAANSN